MAGDIHILVAVVSIGATYCYIAARDALDPRDEPTFLAHHHWHQHLRDYDAQRWLLLIWHDQLLYLVEML